MKRHYKKSTKQIVKELDREISIENLRKYLMFNDSDIDYWLSKLPESLHQKFLIYLYKTDFNDYTIPLALYIVKSVFSNSINMTPYKIKKTIIKSGIVRPIIVECEAYCKHQKKHIIRKIRKWQLVLKSGEYPLRDA